MVLVGVKDEITKPNKSVIKTFFYSMTDNYHAILADLT